MPDAQVIAINRESRSMAAAVGGLGQAFSENSWIRPASFLRETGHLGGKLLLLGHDEILQRTRLSLLEKAGFHCQSAADVSLLRLAHDTFKLLILCHTLTLAEACHAVEQVYLRSPSTTILRLARYARVDEESCFRHVLVAPTPDRLIATVQRLSKVSL